MRRLLFLMPILLCAAVSAHAQSLDAFKQRLAEPTPGATLFNRACVFSDNGPAARDGAFAAKALFEETYPDVKVYVDYEIPYFIVSAGNCLTKEEAIMLKGRVSATFPKAFLKQLKREKSPISNLLDQ